MSNPARAIGSACSMSMERKSILRTPCRSRRVFSVISGTLIARVLPRESAKPFTPDETRHSVSLTQKSTFAPSLSPTKYAKKRVPRRSFRKLSRCFGSASMAMPVHPSSFSRKAVVLLKRASPAPTATKKPFLSSLKKSRAMSSSRYCEYFGRP